jgi:hypothetical protein
MTTDGIDLADRRALAGVLGEIAAGDTARIVSLNPDRAAQLLAAAAEHLAGEAGEHIRMRHTARYYEQRARDALNSTALHAYDTSARRDSLDQALVYAQLAMAAATDELNLPPVGIELQQHFEPADDPQKLKEAVAHLTGAQLVLACGHRVDVEPGPEIDEYNARIERERDGEQATWLCPTHKSEQAIEYVRRHSSKPVAR